MPLPEFSPKRCFRTWTGAIKCIAFTLLPVVMLLARPGFAAPSVVILVRHAEKMATGEDPGLTPAGKQRAEHLARMFRESGVTAIFTSELRRTKETAAPLAKLTGINPAELAGVNVKQHRDRILAVPTGVVIVVGHTNTVPELMTALGVNSAPAIDDSEFEKIFIIVLSGTGQSRMLPMRYP